MTFNYWTFQFNAYAQKSHISYLNVALHTQSHLTESGSYISYKFIVRGPLQLCVHWYGVKGLINHSSVNRKGHSGGGVRGAINPYGRGMYYIINHHHRVIIIIKWQKQGGVTVLHTHLAPSHSNKRTIAIVVSFYSPSYPLHAFFLVST